MKDFDETPAALSRPEVSIVDKTKTEYRHAASMRRRKGQILFSFEIENRKLRRVEIQSEKAIGMDGREHTRNKVMNYNPKAVYFYALNIKNAVRKLGRLGFTDIDIEE